MRVYVHDKSKNRSQDIPRLVDRKKHPTMKRTKTNREPKPKRDKPKKNQPPAPVLKPPSDDPSHPKKNQKSTKKAYVPS